MLGTRRGLRVLGPTDLPEVQQLLARDPITNVFVDHRVRLTRLEPRWLGGEIWGYDEGRGLVSLCHVAANLSPVQATPGSPDGVRDPGPAAGPQVRLDHGRARGRDGAVAACSHRIGVRPDRCGPGSRSWSSTARRVIAVSPDVRRVRPDEIDLLYPACVAMYTEELGVSPETSGGAALYRARVAQLIAKGHAFAHIDDGEVLFKAEIGALTPHACQLQSVWITPRLRGQGLANAYVAAACVLAQQEAPVISLYVNEHNEAARRAYATVGFTDRCRLRHDPVLSALSA